MLYCGTIHLLLLIYVYMGHIQCWNLPMIIYSYKFAATQYNTLPHDLFLPAIFCAILTRKYYICIYKKVLYWYFKCVQYKSKCKHEISFCPHFNCNQWTSFDVLVEILVMQPKWYDKNWCQWFGRKSLKKRLKTQYQGISILTLKFSWYYSPLIFTLLC